MRTKTTLLFTFALSAMIFSGTARAGDDEEFCPDLWYKRNAIYDALGYCFVTAKAIRTFDNSDCYTRNPRFTPWEKREIARIKRLERRMGCTAGGNSAPG